MGVLARRGAVCIFNPYHPKDGAEGFGNGIIWSQGDVVGPESPEVSLKWGDTSEPQINQYPLFSWWKGDNPSSGLTDGAWFPQGDGNRISKKKGGGYLFLYFDLEIVGYGHIYGGSNFLYGRNKIGGGSDSRPYYLGSHIPYTKPGGIWNSPHNPPFPSGTEFKSNSSARTTYRREGQDPNAPFWYWDEDIQTLNPNGSITIEFNRDIPHPPSWDPTTEGWVKWFDYNGPNPAEKYWWKETGTSVNSEYFYENYTGSPFRYQDPIIVPRDDEADNYPEFDISSTDLTSDESTQYGIYESENSGNIYNTYKFLCWNTPVSEYPWRKDFKTLTFKLTANRWSQDCDTGCSYAGKKFKFKLTYQEGDMTIALNGNNTYTGNSFFATKSTITWGAIKTESITVNPLKVEDWSSGPVINQKEVWTKNWYDDTIGRGKARRLIDFYLESIEDE